MASKSGKSPVIWVLMGLLILGLGGFGATNLGGGIRSIGSVGAVDIPVQDYFNGLQQEQRVATAQAGQPVSFADLENSGAVARVQANLIAQAAFDNETRDLGISVGDETLRNEILTMQQFQGIDGSFDESRYRLTLDQSGQSVSQFERGVRADTARSLLQAAVLAGITTPQPYSDTVLRYLTEQRDVSFAMLDQSDLLTGLPVPDEATLRAFHGDNPDLFTTPQSKRISYAWLSPDMLIDAVEVDESSLREAYEDQAADFNQPERRLVERLVFGTEAEAQTAQDRVSAGDISFEDLVAERGLALADIDLGDVTRDDLGAIADAVFAAEVGDVAGPLASHLGPALFRINASLAAQTTSFEEALPQLRSELAADRARRVADQSMDTVDDLLAGGATVEDVAQETDLQSGQINWHEGITDGIAAYSAFRTAAADVTTEDYPEAIQLDDGGVFAIQLDAVEPAALQPFEEVRNQVEAAWRAQAVVSELTKSAEAQVKRLNAGESFDDLGLSIDGAQSLSRSRLSGETPVEFVETVFDMAEGEARLIEGDGRVYLLKLDQIVQADTEDETTQQLQLFLENQVAAGISQDLYAVVANQLRSQAGVDLDFSAINAVHTNFN